MGRAKARSIFFSTGATREHDEKNIPVVPPSDPDGGAVRRCRRSRGFEDRQGQARACVTCHEVDGSSQSPDTPHIGGRVEPYLAEQLHRYKNGKREHPVMSIVARGLSDRDIEDLAAWFAAVKVTQTPVE